MGNITYNDSGELRTITLSGRIDISGRESMAQLVDLAQARKKVIVNLVALTMLASVGIRALVISAKKVAASGGTLVLVADSTSNVMKSLKVAGVDQLVPIYASVTDADRAASV
jgi:anti-anti-sigma factor